MKAGIVVPGSPGSAALADVPEPSIAQGEVLLRVLEVGIDGTDVDIARGEYGTSPPGESRLVAGHEAIAEVVESNLRGLPRGRLVVPMVRRPDDCVNCRGGHMDMCMGGNYRECGIRGANGYLRERVAVDPRYLVPLPKGLRHAAVLTEPASVATKGISQALAFHDRAVDRPHVALVLGAGSLGLLSVAILRLGGLEVHGLDILPESDEKARLVVATGAKYIDGRNVAISQLPGTIGNIDLIVEATGNSTVAFQAMSTLGTNGVLCLLGVGTGKKTLSIDASSLDLKLVLGNKVVFGSVNSGRRHYEEALQHLAAIAAAWPGWIERLITRRLPIDRFKEAFDPVPGSIKTVIKVAGP